MTLYVKPKANASFVGWKIEDGDTLFTRKADELTNNYVVFHNDPSRLYSDVLSDGTLRATIYVRRSLNLTAVFERKAPAKVTLTVQYPPDRPEVSLVFGQHIFITPGRKPWGCCLIRLLSPFRGGTSET